MNENSVILISLFWFFLGSSVVAGFMDASLYCWIFAAISALFLLSVIQTPKELTVSISHMTSKTLISKTDDGYTSWEHFSKILNLFSLITSHGLVRRSYDFKPYVIDL
ncbi:hypothetical protein KO16_22400 [Salmonella enterica subsp. enterica serovar Heidelberg]|nr:hypothetical protein [Salmonella enterica subsp. enterica serovar Heidelberg]